MKPRSDCGKSHHGAVSGLYFHTILPNYIRLATKQYRQSNRNRTGPRTPCGLVKHVMPAFDVDREEITTFEVDGTYLFKQYFDRNGVFDALESYYNSDKHWFEVPEDELNDA